MSKELAAEYAWWFEDVIRGAVEASAKEHGSVHERLSSDEGGLWYTDENGKTFEIELSVRPEGSHP